MHWYLVQLQVMVTLWESFFDSGGGGLLYGKMVGVPVVSFRI